MDCALAARGACRAPRVGGQGVGPCGAGPVCGSGGSALVAGRGTFNPARPNARSVVGDGTGD